MPQPTAQVRSLIRGHLGGQSVSPGELVWTSAELAHRWIGGGLAEPIIPGPSIAPAAGPAERPEAGPAETPALEVPEKKSVLIRSPGWPVERLSRVAPAWAGETAVCVASGLSLTRAQAELTRGARDRDGCPVRVVAVNDAYLRAPWADVLYFADAKWWRWHRDRPEFKAFAGEKCTILATGNAVEDPAIHILAAGASEGLSLAPGALCTGSNSGHQALNLAALARPRRILLLGYDARREKGKPSHFFGEHPDRSETPYEVMRSRMRLIARDLAAAKIEVVNCSPGSALDCFPRGELDRLLADQVAAVL